MRGAIVFAVAIVLCVIAAPAHALDYPHFGINNIGCDSCHFIYGSQPSLLPPWTEHVPQDIDDTQFNTLCWSCHNDIDAPYVKTHSSLQTDNGYGDWTIECRVCHDPHYQQQLRTYGSASYLYSGASTGITASTITKTGAGWTANAYQGYIVFPNVSQKNYNYEILSNTTDTLTVQGPMNLTKATIGNTFAIVYGKLINQTIDLGKITITPSKSGSKTLRFFNPTGMKSFSDGDATYDGVCEVCHTQTTHFRNNGSGPQQLHTNVGVPAGTNCISCHSHVNGFAHGGGGGTGCGDASSCHGLQKSHPTHLGGMGKQLSLACSDCHDTSSFPQFKDGRNLADTTACNPCHSPEGTYDGVNDPDFGVKNNFADGVYESNGSLKAGKEKWCASCHDESPSVIQGVTAPNVIGDEDGIYTYGTGWGFYKTGHGLSSSSTYPASGSVTAGAGKECLDCHDSTLAHIDGNARTFDCSNGCDSTEYKNGYRLKLVGGQTPMQVPFTGSANDSSQFRLCYSCHNSGPFTTAGNMNTNLVDHGTNYHEYHLIMNAQYPADYNYSGPKNSRPTCVICHNVHGSTRLAMVNDGKLINREPGLQIWYRNDDIVKWTSTSNPPAPENLPLSASKGLLLFWNSTMNLCDQCHSSANLGDTLRTPYQNVQQAPTLAWTGQTGYEADGVNPDSAPGGSSFRFRVKYADLNNDAPTLYQVWIDQNNDSDYDDFGEKQDMSPLHREDTIYLDGKIYTYATTLSTVGNLNYIFKFADASANATGVPASPHQVTVTNHAPVLSWTGEMNYETDGVSPDSGTQGGHFIFRITYTDIDNNPPSEIKVWFDGNATTMTEVDAGDTDYTNGKLYTADIVLSSAGNYNYSFSAKDSNNANASGYPTSNKAVTVTTGANAPDLAWTGETGYTTDGVDPDSGPRGGHFMFRVKYTDADNNSLSEIKVWVDGSATTMTEVDTNDTDYANGKLYFADMVLSSAGDYNYSFSAKDSTSRDAVGDPVGNNTVTVSNSLTVCASGANYTSIQAAINAASNGNYIVVCDGVYSEKIDFSGKAIIVQSVNGAASTMIQGDNTNNPVVTFSSSETSSAVLKGFTIDNQYGTESTLNRGIYISGSAAPTIRDCIIQGNKLGFDGAGIYINNGSATIENTTIGGDSANMNSCRYGCGIYATVLSAPLSINNSAISWNSSTGTSAGGGIYLADTTKTTTILNTKFSNNSTQKGSAIYSTGSPVTIDNSAFSNNTGSINGGALYLDNASTTATITGSAFNNNHSDGHGGAIYASSAGALSINNSIFNSNSGGSNGGGMSLNNMNGVTTISHVSISNNSANGHGAGIYFATTAVSSLSLSNCSVYNNTAQNLNGGGLSLSGGSLSATISDSAFSGNSALNGHGGGIYAGGGTVTINNTSVNSNNGGGNGGGVYFSGTMLTISKGFVSGNKTTSNGGSGGLYLGSGSAAVTNSFITGNDGEGNNGGGIWNNGASLNVINSTIAGNYASRFGGGLYGSGTIRNSIIWGNTNISGWAGPQINGPTTVTSSDIGQDGYAGSNGNINSDPLFVDFLQADIDAPIAGGDFHIISDSPAKNIANNSDAPADDIDGQARPLTVGEPADMGADEYLSLEAEVPVVMAFTVTSPSNSLVIPITAFTAIDNVGVTGYRITASATPPSILGGGWSAVAPTTYIVDSDGTYTLYPWARDAAGNVSAVFGTPGTVTVNTGAPTVSSTTPSSSATNVARNSAVTINWNESVDCTTANISTITISPSIGWTKTSCSGSQVVFAASGQIGSTTYTVTVSSSVKDIAGNQMASKYQFSYTTVAPTVAAPTIGTPSALSTTSIRWNFTDHATNEDGFKVHDSSNTVKASSATPDLSYLDETGLTANTQYTRHVHAYKTDEDSLPSADASRYTLPLVPNVTADKTTSTWYTTSDVVFTDAAGFGSGAVQYYRYAWDTNATHTFTDSETQWTTGTLTKTATSEAGWYLHVKSYNGDNIANATTADYGPYNYDMTVLAVSTTVPINGTSSVVLDSNVTINFNENVDCTTVTTSTVTINPSVGWTRASCSGSQGVFTPNGQIGATQYTVTVSTLVKDANSISLSSSYPFSYTTVAAGGVITVCASGCDFTTIQGAINDAGTTNGKVVRVSNGTYSENINFNGKLITVQSVNGAANTKIQGATSSTNSPVVTFSTGETSSAVLDGFTIDNQASDTATRGIYISGASPTIKNSIIEGNSCYAAEGGAGVYIYNSVPTFDTCTIRANSATNNMNGGGMSIKGAAGGATITNSTIGSSGNANTATNYGGGIYFAGPSTGTLSISGSTIAYNSANAGGGIYLTGVTTTTTITNTSVSNNTSNWTPGGGGIYSNNSALSLTNSNINNNTCLGSTAFIGGGIYLNGASASATILGGTINGNQSGSFGGGIYINGSTAATPLSISNATISDNIAEGQGGGIYLTGVTNTVTISGTTISGNTSQTKGAGIYNNAVTLTITDSHIDSNISGAYQSGGGGLSLTGAKTTTITNSTVNGNTTNGGKGGGIYNTGGATLVITGGSINSNTSSADSGGGVAVDSTSTLTISKANIRGNNATENYGGAIYYASTSGTAASITNCTITGNLAKGSWGDGGGTYTSSGTFNLTNSTVAGNYALRNGGGMIKAGGAVNVKNSILWGNTAGNSGTQISGTPTVTYSDIEGAFAGTGNINSDPSFTSFITPDDKATSTTPKTTGNFHIQSGSPVIDIGTATGTPSVDIDGESRPQPLGGAYDMGSDEFVIIPPGSPTFDWTGESNYTTDGVNPDSARSGSNFEFRIKYTDAENNPPSSIQVWIDQDNDGSYASGEKHDMTEVDPGDTTYTDGKLYSSTLTLTNAGSSNLNLNYRFYASDGTNDVVGAPTANQVVTVTPALQVPGGYSTIQAAINAASNGETISVSDGTYSENIDYGDKNITIISVNGAAATTIQGATTGTNLPVVTFNSVPLTNSAVLDGFTINNQATASTLTRGIYIAGGAAPTVQNCTITGNSVGSSTDGAGIYITDAAATSVKLKNSIVSSNSARGKTGIWALNSNLDITDTIIESNTATGSSSDGAGVYADGGTVNIDRSKIRGNSSARNGGGIYAAAGTTTIKNSNITGNVAATDGGGVRVNGGTLSIYNSAVAGNYAGATGGGGARVVTGTLNITNSIIYGNTSSGGAGILRSSGTVSINYSSYQAISGACTSCANNRPVGEDPLFQSFVAGDQAGSGAPKTSGDFHIQSGSPCRNTGTNTGAPADDIDGNSRPQEVTVDMGSDEYVP